MGGTVSFGCLSPSTYYAGSNCYLNSKSVLYLEVCSVVESRMIGYVMIYILGSCPKIVLRKENYNFVYSKLEFEFTILVMLLSIPCNGYFPFFLYYSVSLNIKGIQHSHPIRASETL